MTLQLAQLGTMIKYELLMSWRRRSLIVTVLFLFVGLAVFTATIQKEPLGAEGGEILYMDDTVTPATVTLRLYETGEVTTIPADDAILANIPNWLRNVDLEQVNATLKVATLLPLVTQLLIIMLLLTRSVVAAATIVGTVAISLGASFGLSILIWQHILGIELHWMVMAMSVIILLAVGADYNLLLVSRLKEELHAGINTGIIRAMGGSGSVVTSAGLVFAFTMMSMAVSELTVVGQVGTTIGLGLLFDTLVVRAFMTPSIAALLGRWFWWPQRVRQRPVPSPWPKPTHELAPAGPEGDRP